MLTVVIGGSASGKSEYAEGLVLQTGILSKIYIATMQPFDEECHRRIARHRAMRRDKGFQTVECYTNLQKVCVSRQSVVLLECMGNLVANEFFSPEGAGKNAAAEIMAGIERLCAKAAQVIVVTNDIFADGVTYDPETEKYLSLLGEVNRRMGEKAEQVIEVVCGIPLIKKGAAQ